ncbi:helix-turn-helix transcriptional regulator [Defluviitalea saccharophila]|uniref:Helix-turn-helix transcriptional regulator n=1 Tax=Defluviitalea saccharophila TaxID=879970 RepID=A0ABZ2Y9I5_9FIRM
MRNNLITFRKQQGYTQDEFANILNVSSSYYQKIENGTRNPSYNFIKNFKEAFKSADVDMIFFNQ